MSEYKFKEVATIPKRRGYRHRSSKYAGVINEAALRLEQTPETRWLEIEGNPPFTRQEAKQVAGAIYAYFMRIQGQGALERRVRENGSPDEFAVYVRRGKNYK